MTGWVTRNFFNHVKEHTVIYSFISVFLSEFFGLHEFLQVQAI